MPLVISMRAASTHSLGSRWAGARRPPSSRFSAASVALLPKRWASPLTRLMPPVAMANGVPPAKWTWDNIAYMKKQCQAMGWAIDWSREVASCDASYYKWKAKFGGMELSDAKRLKALEQENSKLKRLLADALLDNAALKDVVSRKW